MEIVKDIKNSSELSEFFSALSKEKDDTRQKIKENIDNPESGLSSLFQQLEEALQETKKVSVEEIPDNTKLSADDQNKLDVFSNLLNALDSDKEIPIKVEPIDFVEELEPEEIIPEELVVESEEPHEIIEPQDEIIASVIRNLDDMRGKTQVKEEVDQISSIRKEFDNFRSLIAQQIASSQMSGAGSGEVRLEFLDDIQRSTAKVDGKFLKYSSSDSKWIGADASGSGSSAADDISAGDAAVNITTTSGNITIDAAANNSDIILKGTDGGADTTFLTIDGSAAGAATFNDKVIATELDISGDLASAVIKNSGQITSDSFNLPITLNGSNGSSANAGDNIVQDTAANANDRLVYEDSTLLSIIQRPITWDRTT